MFIDQVHNGGRHIEGYYLLAIGQGGPEQLVAINYRSAPAAKSALRTTLVEQIKLHYWTNLILQCVNASRAGFAFDRGRWSSM